jgi:Cu/Ag efflux protein CusF
MRIVGSVTAIDGQSVTVKPDTGASVTFTVNDSARILETQPGAKTLTGATPIQLTVLSIGDRVLAVVRPAADGSAMTATTLVAMKQADLAQHQQAEEADWQRRGVGGLVKTVDASAGTVTIASAARALTIHATPKTIVRRYSPDSIKFADAQPSALSQIQPGDQLRARGDRSADGSDITADEIVAGTFRNIAGTVLSIDLAANTVTVRDLAAKKPVIIHVTADSQMHKLPEQMAQSLAMRLKHSGNGQAEARPASEAGAASSGSGDHAGWRQSGGGQRGGDLSQMLQHTPPVQLSELHKGDAVMIVATAGTPDAATAVTLLAGVEPILTASPSASQSMFSASWNVGGGEAGAGEEGTTQ